jgi:hypothetical protein
VLKARKKYVILRMPNAAPGKSRLRAGGYGD